MWRVMIGGGVMVGPYEDTPPPITTRHGQVCGTSITQENRVEMKIVNFYSFFFIYIKIACIGIWGIVYLPVS